MSGLEPCYRHADRLTGLHCTRCGKPTCPDCMIPAPVGHHCLACVADARKDMAKVRAVTWSRPRAGVVVLALLAANVVVHVLAQGDPTLRVRFGNLRVGVVSGEYYRLITSAFVHRDWSHLAFNCFSLAFLGTLVEPVLGKARFVALYLLSAVGGSVATLLFGPPFSAGASGAVFGVMGAAWILLRKRNLDTSRLVGLAFFNLLVSFWLPEINWVSHVGGLIAGILVAAGFESGLRPRVRDAGTVAAVAFVLVALVPAGVRWSPDPGRVDVAALMERQRELVEGVEPAVWLAQPPLIQPQYQAVRDGAAAYQVYVYQDPASARTVRIDFGDGTKDEVAVPAGAGVRRVEFEHRFPRGEARFNQRVNVDGISVDSLSTASTDVCPGGTRRATAQDKLAPVESPVCVRF